MDMAIWLAWEPELGDSPDVSSKRGMSMETLPEGRNPDWETRVKPLVKDGRKRPRVLMGRMTAGRQVPSTAIPLGVIGSRQ